MKKIKLIKTIVLCLISLGLLISLATCKKFGIPDYEVTIKFDEGIEGFPEAGIHTYEDLTRVEYSYVATDPKHSIEVVIENINLNIYGSFTVYGNMEINVKKFDVRGQWELLLLNEGGTETLETYNITFYGQDMLGGTTLDSRGKTGTWIKDGNKIDILHDDWENYTMVCGVVISNSFLLTLRGTWWNDDETGWWEAKRIVTQ